MYIYIHIYACVHSAVSVAETTTNDIHIYIYAYIHLQACTHSAVPAAEMAAGSRALNETLTPNVH